MQNFLNFPLKKLWCSDLSCFSLSMKLELRFLFHLSEICLLAIMLFDLFSFTLSDSKGLYLQSPLFVLQRDLTKIITPPLNLSHCSPSSLLLFLVKIRIAAIVIFLENASWSYLTFHLFLLSIISPPQVRQESPAFLLPTRFFISHSSSDIAKMKEQIVIVLRKRENTFVFNTEDLSHSKLFPENS